MGQQVLDATKRLYDRQSATMAHSGKLLIDAAHQHGAADLGLQMYRETPAVVGALHTQPSFVTYAAANLVIRCSMTAIDLCAASARWTIHPDPSHSDVHEYDVEKWAHPPGKQLANRLDSRLRRWLTETRASQTYDDLKVCRDGYTHKHVRMDAVVRPATIAVGGSLQKVPQPSEQIIHVGGKVFPLQKSLPLFVDFTTERIDSYASALLQAIT